MSRLLELEVAFLKFSIKTYPSNIDQVNQILESCTQILRSSTLGPNDQAAMKLLVKLLTIPLETLSIAVLGLNHYPTLMKYMKFSNRRVVALKIVKAVLKDRKPLSSSNTVDQLIEFVTPLLQDDEDGSNEEPYEFEEGQEAVARLLHLITHKWHGDIHYELLMRFKRIFVKGGNKRQKYTLPATIFSLLRLSRDLTFRRENPIAEEEKVLEEGEDVPSGMTPVT